MHPFHLLLVLFGIASLAAFAFMLRWERRQFVQRGKGNAWLSVRIATVPIALMTAAIILIPTLSGSGMEALAVFYLLLLVIAPVLWFGAHWIVGRCVTPALAFAESAQIAGSPLVFGIVVAIVAHQLQPLAWQLLKRAAMA